MTTAYLDAGHYIINIQSGNTHLGSIELHDFIIVNTDFTITKTDIYDKIKNIIAKTFVGVSYIKTLYTIIYKNEKIGTLTVNKAKKLMKIKSDLDFNILPYQKNNLVFDKEILDILSSIGGNYDDYSRS